MHADSCKFDRKLFDKYVARGLCSGPGDPEKQVCVEVALSIACGYPTPTDRPECALPASRRYAILLNDKDWSSAKARSKGMKSLALAQLGTSGLSSVEFCRRLAEESVRQIVPVALRAAAKRNPSRAVELETAALRCEKEGTRESASEAKKAAADVYDAAASAYAAAYAARDAAAASYAYAAYASAAYAASYAHAAAYDAVPFSAHDAAHDAERKWQGKRVIETLSENGVK